MAPVVSKRKAAEAKASKLERPPLFGDEAFPSTKDDKRRIKHSTFVSRIEKSGAASKHKRRRPSKKLVTTLESLADALPEAEKLADGQDVEVGNVRIKHKSLKSRPGAMKKKAKLETMEKDRFQKNLVEMATGSRARGSAAVTNPNVGGAAQPATASSERWAALRSFIGATMDKGSGK